MRSRRFKSTPPRRPYRLPSEKLQVNVSARLHKPVLVNVDFRNPATFVEHAPSALETHMSDIDSDELNDVPLACMIKKTFVSDVTAERPIDPLVSVHSQESSSTEGVFVPTSSLQHTSNIELGSSPYSSPVRSPVPNTTSFGPNNDPASTPADESAATEERTNVHNDENKLEPANPDNHTGEIPIDADNNLVGPIETHAFPEESRPTKKKSQ
ncbi:envelope-like protein [Cucumis melo var. makuwa]|uniref:Envelope-like protein n=1 Tax=Cucumis melo var. makuwa TaxID=1194695 RepID=A0A5A7UPS8_CUCMM|nr:envelope-like protein [Cucumis melo var. makuwa]TYK08951.1 envelope-like protein [Cucumis melo var. makuwa]